MFVSTPRIAALACAVLALAALSTPAHAQVTVFTAPFAGTATESFESFPNYLDQPGFFLANPTPIFGGAAFLTGDLNLIYEPSQNATFGLGSNGSAQVADGIKGLGSTGRDSTFTITFNGPITQFGGYFNGIQSTQDSDTVTFSFFDARSNLIGSETFDVNPNNTTNGALNFYGFSSTTAFSSVSITSDAVVADSLRYTAARVPPQNPVPEPSQWAGMGMASFALCGLMVRARRRKNTPTTA